MGSILDDLGAELLVRILRAKKLDARHMSAEDVHRELPTEASPGGVSLVYLVSIIPGEERNRAVPIAAALLARFAHPCLVTLFLPGLALRPEPTIDTIESADKAATSLGEALQICLDWLQERTKS